jgi:membrane protease YdiL (CAAX protease family)
MLMLVVSVFAILTYGIIKGFPKDQAELIKDPNAIVINLAAILPIHLLTILAAWWLVTRGGKQPFLKTLGWSWSKNFGFWACLGVTIGMYMLAGLVIYVFGEQENELTRILKSSRTAVYITAFIAALTAPFAEEVVYRGVLYPPLERKFGVIPAIILITTIFAGIHVPQYLDYDKMHLVSSYGTIIVICALSLVLTSIRAWTKSLLPCFVIHTIFNGIQAVLLVVEPYIPNSKAPGENSQAFIHWLTILCR